MTVTYRDVDIRVADLVTLSHVNLQVEEGELIYLHGPVGCGKSSLLKSMYGETEIVGGEAEVLGFDLRKLSPKKLPNLRRQLGVVFQDFKLLTDRTVSENLDFVLRVTDWNSRKERRERIEEVLELVCLQDSGKKRPYELSGGEQQRICIARAILNRPKMILADEPTGNLDMDNGERVMVLLDEIRRQVQTSVLVSTHNLQWMEYFPGREIEVEQFHSRQHPTRHGT